MTNWMDLTSSLEYQTRPLLIGLPSELAPLIIPIHGMIPETRYRMTDSSLFMNA